MTRNFAAHFITTTLIAFFFLSVPARASSIDELRKEYRAVQETVSAQEEKIVRLSTQLDRVSKQVEKQKKEVKKAPSFFGNYRLQTKLQKAQKISKKLHRVSRQRTKTQAQLATLRTDLLEALGGEIGVLQKKQKASTQKAKKQALARKIAGLSQEQQHVMLSQEKTPYPTHAETLLGNGDTPQEASERLKAIQDFERRLVKEIETMERNLRRSRRQKFVRAEVSHLLEEEEFFSERGFLRGAPSRTEKRDSEPASPDTIAQSGGDGTAPSTDVAAPTTDSTATADTSPSVPTDPIDAGVSGDIAATGVTEPSMETAPSVEGLDSSTMTGFSRTIIGPQPPIEAPTEISAPVSDSLSTDSSIASTVPSGDSGAGLSDSFLRDPLAQLASEFGISTEEYRKISESGRGSALDKRILLIQSRLSTSREILKLLRSKAKKLEHRASQ